MIANKFALAVLAIPVMTQTTSFHVGFTPSGNQAITPLYSSTTQFQPLRSSSPIAGSRSYFPSQAYPRPADVAFPYTTSFNEPTNIQGGMRWVKIAEGHEPIAVPYGVDPTQFLENIRLSRGLPARRFLTQKELPMRMAQPMMTPTKHLPVQVPTKIIPSKAIMPFSSKRPFPIPTKKAPPPPVNLVRIYKIQPLAHAKNDFGGDYRYFSNGYSNFGAPVGFTRGGFF